MTEEDPQEYSGTFWIEGQSSREAGGTLIFREGVAPRLHLNGELTPSFEVVETTDETRVIGAAKRGPEVENLLIHGSLVDQISKVTLVGAFTVRQRGQLFGGGPSEQVFQARYAIVGEHLSRDELAFDFIALRFSNLDEWARLPGFDLTRSLKSAGASISFSLPTPVEAALSDGSTIRIRSQMRAPWEINPREMRITRDAWFEIQSIAPKTWRDIDRLYVSALQNFLQLCTMQSCRLIAVHLGRGDATYRMMPSRLWPSSASDDWRSFPLLLPHVALETVVEWLDCVLETHPTASVLANSFIQPSISIESRLLELTTVAEGFHRSLFPQQDRLDTATASRVKQSIRTSILTEEQRVQNIVKGRMGYIEEMSYPKRLLDLATEANLVIPGVSGHTKRWTDLIAESRNTFAHGKSAHLGEAGS